MEKEPTFARGIYFNEPRQNAPDFVLGQISIKVTDAIPFLEANKNAAGYVTIDVKKSRAGKPYTELNTFVPSQKKEEVKEEPDTNDPGQFPAEASDALDIPF